MKWGKLFGIVSNYFSLILTLIFLALDCSAKHVALVSVCLSMVPQFYRDVFFVGILPKILKSRQQPLNYFYTNTIHFLKQIILFKINYLFQ